MSYEIASDVGHGRIKATVSLPARTPAEEVLLRLRHPRSAPIRSVTVNGATWKDVDRAREVVILRDVAGTVKVEVIYAT